MSKVSTQIETLVVDELLEQVVETSILVIHNDDVNTMDFVVNALMEICGMPSEQAEQCTLIIHYKGKYGVKDGSLNDLRPLKDAFIDRGINATIE